MLARGYVYAVCQRGQRHSAKVGFTTALEVERFIYESYSRSLTPLEIVLVLPASKARLAESVFHHAMSEQRLHDKHELFDLSDGLGPLWRARDLVLAKRPLPGAHLSRLGTWSPKPVACDGAGQQWCRWPQVNYCRNWCCFQRAEPTRPLPRLCV